MSLVHTQSLREETIPNLDEDLVFQVTDIADRDSRRVLSKDEQRDITETARREGISHYSVMEQENPRLYQILMSGVTPDGIPVTVTVGGFRPFFYIKVPGGDSRVPAMTSVIAAIRDGNF